MTDLVQSFTFYSLSSLTQLTQLNSLNSTQLTQTHSNSTQLTLLTHSTHSTQLNSLTHSNSLKLNLYSLLPLNLKAPQKDRFDMASGGGASSSLEDDDKWYSVYRWEGETKKHVDTKHAIKDLAESFDSFGSSKSPGFKELPRQPVEPDGILTLEEFVRQERYADFKHSEAWRTAALTVISNGRGKNVEFGCRWEVDKEKKAKNIYYFFKHSKNVGGSQQVPATESDAGSGAGSKEGRGATSGSDRSPGQQQSPSTPARVPTVGSAEDVGSAHTMAVDEDGPATKRQKMTEHSHGDRDETGVLHRTKAVTLLERQQKMGDPFWLPGTGALKIIKGGEWNNFTSQSAELFRTGAVSLQYPKENIGDKEGREKLAREMGLDDCTDGGWKWSWPATMDRLAKLLQDGCFLVAYVEEDVVKSTALCAMSKFDLGRLTLLCPMTLLPLTKLLFPTLRPHSHVCGLQLTWTTTASTCWRSSS